MSIGSAVLLVLLLSSGCEDRGSRGRTIGQDLAGTRTARNYTLAITGIAENVSAGTAINVGVHVVSVDVDKNGQAHNAAQLEVVLSIVCGTREQRLQQLTDSEGVATFAPFTPDNSWVGDCTATASVTARELEKSITFVVSGEHMPQLVVGLEYVVSALQDEDGDIYNGFLSLHDCAGAQLIAITNDDTHPIFAGNGDGVAINRSKNWQYVVVGDPSPQCKLMLASSAGGRQREIRRVVSPPAGDNAAQGKVSALRKLSAKQKKLVVVTAQVKSGSLYVYDHGIDTWQGVRTVAWGGNTTTAIDWSSRARDNRILLKVTHGSKNWWVLVTAHMTIGEVRAGIGGGRLFSVHDVGTEAVRVRVDNACGLQVFHLRKRKFSAVLQEIATTALALTPNREGEIKNLFALGKPEEDCRFSLNVDGATVFASKTVAHDYVVLMVMRQSGSDNIQVSSNGEGVVKPLYVSNRGAEGFRRAKPSWQLNTRATLATKWNSSNANHNQALAIRAKQEVFYAYGR